MENSIPALAHEKPSGPDEFYPNGIYFWIRKFQDEQRKLAEEKQRKVETSLVSSSCIFHGPGSY